jgi:cbb3-type cytochrome oxidase cytochrome c subunit
MPAREETFRNQTRLHVVFALSSIAMTLTIVWMIMADHLRPWKETQREFHYIEDAKLRVEEQKRQDELNKQQLDELAARIEAADRTAEENAKQIRAQESELKKIGGKYEQLDTATRFLKAELDSQRSEYDLKIDLNQNREARNYLNDVIVPSEKRLLELRRELETVKAQKTEAETRIASLQGNVDAIKKEQDKLTLDRDRVTRLREQKEQQYFGLPAFLRGLPLIDAAAPPTKIQQISLPELTINYNFKDVPRYDRCQTCHLGIDRPNYLKDAEGKDLPLVFQSHPHLTDGAMTTDPSGKRVVAGLYLDGNGPHKVNSFGCTICHGGNGSGTDFSYASHEPNTLHQAEEWKEKDHWSEMHHWDEPMLPKRFIESSCIKCHHQVTDVPQAEKLQAGYERIVKYGCTGCHTIGGEGSFGPDLTDERPVGPNLRHIASKVSKEWTLKWIKNPHAFRPDTRMPRFYNVTNNHGEKDQPKAHAEIYAITHYLFAKSVPPADFVEPQAKDGKDANAPPAQASTDATKGKELFFQKGCMACHSHKEFAPETFPASVQQYAKANHGPNLSEMALKFQSNAQGYKWLVNWIKNPEKYHAKSLMPNLQLSWGDSANIASWILSVKGEWPQPVTIPDLESGEVQPGLNELVRLFVTKAGWKDPATQKPQSVSLSEVEGFVHDLKTDDKLMYLGEKTIGRLGCFGCHNISGFETYKSIGTALNGWGVKSPAKLDFGHITEYLQDQKVADDGSRDGTDEFYQEKLGHHTRMGFLYEKLHRPRSYDYKKTSEDLKAWDDRLRMPQFVWADDPKAVEEVMTFVLGLTGEKINSRYLPKYSYSPAQKAVAEGSKLLNRYNCTGCHVVAMPKYTIASDTKLEEALSDFETNVKVAYASRANDYVKELYPKLSYDAKVTPDDVVKGLKAHDGKAVTIEAMPAQAIDNDLSVQVWRPVTIRGFTFNVGDTLTIDKTKVTLTAPEGGNFAWLYATTQAEKTGTDFPTFWNRLPPPLLREGAKVQTPWLTSFLKDPYLIRPAANLRMPRFHYGKDDAKLPALETEGIANYFAAVDGKEFPYQQFPEREQSYLAGLEAKHPEYLAGGWQLMTKGACIQCHAIGQYKPTGGAQVVNGPDLRQVSGRFRPEYLAEWLARPNRLVPYTAMPQNIPPAGPPAPGVPKSMEGQTWVQVKAMRDTLLNYVTAVEGQLAGAAGKPADASKAAAPAPKAAGGGQ